MCHPTPDYRRDRLNQGLRTLATWCESRAMNEHDIATTLSMLERKAKEIRTAVNRTTQSLPNA